MNVLKRIAYSVRDFLVTHALDQVNLKKDAISQIQLKLTYMKLAEAGNNLPNFSEIGFKVFSQADEDGILLYIFSIIGTKNKKCVEVCAGNGIECNSANLIINHGWSGLLIDGQEALIKQGQDFYCKHSNTHIYPPKLVHSWITRENVNKVIKDNGYEGEIDLLSIDMDGVDYWIWDSIEIINPRVVVLEYQDIVGPEKALTVPYKDNFNAHDYPETLGTPNFSGASLRAFVKLAKKKGYRLVGCNRYGYNAFFIREDIGEDKLPEIPIVECFKHPKVIRGIR